jgi:hypothetical protein
VCASSVLVWLDLVVFLRAISFKPFGVNRLFGTLDQHTGVESLGSSQITASASSLCTASEISSSDSLPAFASSAEPFR